MILTGRDVQWYISQGKLVIRPIGLEQFQQNGVDLILDSTVRKSSIFFLGATREYLEMPDDVMAFVELRSTWARKGFLLPPTIVDAGFHGNLTLEILAAMDEPYAQVCPVGERFAHLIFAKCTGPCVPYRGKYQGQSGITDAKD